MAYFYTMYLKKIEDSNLVLYSDSTMNRSIFLSKTAIFKALVRMFNPERIRAVTPYGHHSDLSGSSWYDEMELSTKKSKYKLLYLFEIEDFDISEGHILYVLLNTGDLFRFDLNDTEHEALRLEIKNWAFFFYGWESSNNLKMDDRKVIIFPTRKYFDIENDLEAGHIGDILNAFE